MNDIKGYLTVYPSHVHLKAYFCQDTGSVSLPVTGVTVCGCMNLNLAKLDAITLSKGLKNIYRWCNSKKQTRWNNLIQILVQVKIKMNVVHRYDCEHKARRKVLV